MVTLLLGNAYCTDRARINNIHHLYHSLGSRTYSPELRSAADRTLSMKPRYLVDLLTDYFELLDITLDHGQTVMPVLSASVSMVPWQCPPGTGDL